MDKSATKRFAVWARRELISRVAQKALQYGITDKEIVSADAGSIDGTVLSDTEKKQRKALVEQINKKGYEQVMEEVAYTWFNRFIALRYMEVNSYLSSKVRVFTDENNAFKPQIIDEAIHMELQGLDIEKVYELKEANKVDELYKYLLITQCNALNEVLPRMFPKIEDYTELLFPDNLLREGSVVEQMISLIPEEDWQDAVQIIGWLYQYYNTEKKDEVFAALKKNVKISKDNIPAATQLFTPDWIVRYMVENSLGRLWVEGHPDEEIKKNWKYYLEEAEQEPEVQTKLSEIRKEYANLKPEDIKCIDPCMGSGHILAYMFDVLVQIYEAYGYTTRDAVASIVENNIYGLDIDDRAAQLAYFAVMMKACQYDKRFLKRGIQPNVYAIRESNSINAYALEYFCNGDKKLTADMNKLVSELRDAKEYGSILNVSMVDFDAIESRIREIEDDVNIAKYEVMSELVPLVKVAKNMAQKYEIVITNPPYMGGSGMSPKLIAYVKDKYPDSKSDLFAVFIERCNYMARMNAFQAMITQHSWMFLSDYKKLRASLIKKSIVNMAHLGARAFDEIGGEVVQTTSFVYRKTNSPKYKATFVKLVNESSEQSKADAFGNTGNYYYASNADFERIPDNIHAYWLSEKVLSLLENGKKLGSVGNARQGLATTDNKKYLRLWYEVDFDRIDYCCGDCDEIVERGSKWFPYNKAGSFRKWSCIDEYVVNYENDGAEIKKSVMTKYPYLKNPGFVVKNTDTYFKQGITWNDVSTAKFCCRYVPNGYIYDAAGPMFFSDKDFLLLAYFNSVVFQSFADIICQGLHYSTGHIPGIPFVDIDDKDLVSEIEEFSKANQLMAKQEWDEFETSWDFKRHPLV